MSDIDERLRKALLVLHRYLSGRVGPEWGALSEVEGVVAALRAELARKDAENAVLLGRIARTIEIQEAWPNDHTLIKYGSAGEAMVDALWPVALAALEEKP